MRTNRMGSSSLAGAVTVALELQRQLLCRCGLSLGPRWDEDVAEDRGQQHAGECRVGDGA